VGPVVTLVVAETGEVAHTLEELEEIIGRGLETFKEVGDALAQVRDGRLYLEHAETFEAYCSERWGLKRQRAYELIDAAAVAGALSSMDDTPTPTNERQARALRPLKDDPEKAAEAMRNAAADTGGKPTAKAITEAVKEMVEEKVAAAEAKATDRAELDALKAAHTPDGFDPDAEEKRVTERGKFARLCRDLAALPAPADFVASHREYLRDRHVNGAERAYEWLDTFLLEFRETK
jgi:hypothetical protein